MNKGSKIFEYYQNLCNILNENNFKVWSSVAAKEVEYHVIKETPGDTMHIIAMDKDAYRFLESSGFIRKDMCYRCGKEPIDGKYYFIEPHNRINLNICRDCHPQAKSHIKNNGGCMVLLIVPIIISLVFIYFFMNIL